MHCRATSTESWHCLLSSTSSQKQPHSLQLSYEPSSPSTNSSTKRGVQEALDKKQQTHSQTAWSLLWLGFKQPFEPLLLVEITSCHPPAWKTEDLDQLAFQGRSVQHYANQKELVLCNPEAASAKQLHSLLTQQNWSLTKKSEAGLNIKNPINVNLERLKNRTAWPNNDPNQIWIHK